MEDRSITDIVKTLPSNVKREWIDSPDFLLLALKNPDFEGAILGSYSIYCVRKKTVYVYREGNPFSLPVSPTSIARKIITEMLFRTNRKTYPNDMRIKETVLLSAPLYASPYEGKLIYFDLKSAFYQIYTRMSVYQKKQGNRWLFAPPWVASFLPIDLYRYKLVRNAIPGCWRSNSVSRIKKGQIHRVEQSTVTTNYEAWNFIQSLLNYFAEIALECGAVYIHTDGYIFPYDSQYRHFYEYLKSLYFVIKIKARGHGKVLGIGAYQIGEVKTKREQSTQYLKKIAPSDNIVLTLTQLNKYNPYVKENYEALLIR